MKKIFATIFAVLFVLTVSFGTAFAKADNGVEKDPPGWYYKGKNPNDNNEWQYFPNGHPTGKSEWTYCGPTKDSCQEKPPVDPPPCKDGCKNTATATAIAGPVFVNNIAVETGTYSNQLAQGEMKVTAYAQGEKFAEAGAFAKGKAFGGGFATEIETPTYGIGASGGYAGVMLEGAGYGFGMDKFSYGSFGCGQSSKCYPDYASVKVDYSGSAHQVNGVLVENGNGTFAGGFNSTNVSFYGSSFSSDEGKLLGKDSWNPIAGTIGEGSGFGITGGVSFGTYSAGEGWANASSFTTGGSYYRADGGYVSGEGTAFHGAFAQGTSGWGQSLGTATFCYEGSGNLGLGYAKTNGSVNVFNGAGYTTVTSSSHAQSGSFTGNMNTTFNNPK